MSASNYLPPFTTEERGVAGSRPEPTSDDPDGARPADEVTYADFLGDAVDGDGPTEE